MPRLLAVYTKPPDDFAWARRQRNAAETTRWMLMSKAVGVLMLVSFVVWMGAGLIAGVARAAETEPLPASDAQFAALLQACWVQKTSVGSSTVCFDGDGSAYFQAYNARGHDALIGRGQYRVLNGKVYLEGDGDTWPFERSRMSCDGFVEPLKALALVRCDGAGKSVGDARDAPSSDSVSDKSWRFSGTLAECDWCDMARLE